jgi:hypothetical protein
MEDLIVSPYVVEGRVPRAEIPMAGPVLYEDRPATGTKQGEGS